jgi:hypothetical protein
VCSNLFTQTADLLVRLRNIFRRNVASDCTFYVEVKSGGPIQKYDRLGFISFDKAF